jgi:hypothetical protein
MMKAQTSIRLIPAMPDHVDEERAKPTPPRLATTQSYSIVERSGDLPWHVMADGVRHLSSHRTEDDAVRFLRVLGVDTKP